MPKIWNTSSPTPEALTSVFGVQLSVLQMAALHSRPVSAQVCQSIAYGFSAPIGLMYDLWGATQLK